MDVESRECPRSLITAESQDAIERYFRATRIHEATGGVYYGPDSSLWPARWVDTCNLLSYEVSREDGARAKAFADYQRSLNGRK